MLKPFVALACLLAATPAIAIECPLTHAIYGQQQSATRAIFFQRSRDWAANQIAGFRVELAGTHLDGTVHVPNGFGQPAGRLTLYCSGEEADVDECTLWDGLVYGLVDGRIAELPHHVDGGPPNDMAPTQLLLPGFASAVWYSMLREEAFPGEDVVSDTFDLVACAK